MVQTDEVIEWDDANCGVTGNDRLGLTCIIARGVQGDPGSIGLFPCCQLTTGFETLQVRHGLLAGGVLVFSRALICSGSQGPRLRAITAK
jgi:hypothetical protein